MERVHEDLATLAMAEDEMEGFIREAAPDRGRTRYRANVGMNGANSYRTTGRLQSENGVEG